MLNLYSIISKSNLLSRAPLTTCNNIRTFLSHAYYCDEVWERRLNSPALQNVNPDELYQELDQTFQKTRSVSAVNTDVFACLVENNSYADELLDIIHKLRLSANADSVLNSTNHAVIRALLKWGKYEDLLNALNDRLNYGLFLDYYTANLLLDTFWKSKQYAYGSLVASFLMLQEELDNPLACYLSLLHCYNYLLDPKDWPKPSVLDEPEEEVKVRVKYLRNPFDDDHFDLKDSSKIVGKTLTMISKNKTDPLHQSFYVLGLALHGKNDDLSTYCKNSQADLIEEIINLVPSDNDSKETISKLKVHSENVNMLLESFVKKSYEETCERDISEQCKLFNKWEQERETEQEKEKHKKHSEKQLADIKVVQDEMKKKEELLWFFDNEDQIDLKIESKKRYYPKRWFGKKKKPKKIDENYIPPEVYTKPSDSKLG